MSRAADPLLARAYLSRDWFRYALRIDLGDTGTRTVSHFTRDGVGIVRQSVNLDHARAVRAARLSLRGSLA